MTHPFLSNQQLNAFDSLIDQDPYLPDPVKQDPILREVCRAGLWLVQRLQDNECPEDYLMRIQYTAGAASFGRDPWEVHQQYLTAYLEGDLDFEAEPGPLN